MLARLRRSYVIMAAALLVAACGPAAARDATAIPLDDPPEATAAVSSAASEALQRRLPELARARFIAVSVEWVGLAPSAPYRRWYTWVRRDQGYSGTGTIQVGGFSHPVRTEDLRSSVPHDVIGAAVAALATAQLVDERYTPHIPMTDDYPAIVIAFHIGDDEVTFYTRSQGETHQPWACMIGQREYTVAGDEPYRMYQQLIPYLGADIEQRMIAAQAKEGLSTPVP